MEHIVDGISSCGGCGPAPGQKPISPSLSPSGTTDRMAADLSPGYGGHTLERWLCPDGGNGRPVPLFRRSRQTFAAGTLRVGAHGRAERGTHTKDGFDVRAAVVA
jgi:hypothetical protein